MKKVMMDGLELDLADDGLEAMFDQLSLEARPLSQSELENVSGGDIYDPVETRWVCNVCGTSSDWYTLPPTLGITPRYTKEFLFSMNRHTRETGHHGGFTYYKK